MTCSPLHVTSDASELFTHYYCIDGFFSWILPGGIPQQSHFQGPFFLPTPLSSHELSAQY